MQVKEQSEVMFNEDDVRLTELYIPNYVYAEYWAAVLVSIEELHKKAKATKNYIEY